ncbi:TOBE domain-containing protein [Asanoa hainanensis]|uniref:TOBE domain-containing protein n=1 Tax=Asanoa hainanensis TaxID=560556 RepID=A0A239P1H3_9ACTN|nr:TOBE domain-containing protein [Asanoa hainanensis]SNT60850.1 TOBE domain-containing protein [Asanoa hainanensis]
MIVGIRPHALVWPAPIGSPQLTATITGREFLGNAEHLFFAAPGAASSDDGAGQWTARVEADCALAPGDEVTFGVDTGELHLFDPASGAALLRAGLPERCPSGRSTVLIQAVRM